MRMRDEDENENEEGRVWRGARQGRAGQGRAGVSIYKYCIRKYVGLILADHHQLNKV